MKNIFSLSFDKIGKDALEKQHDNLLKYKDEVPITMLSMVDDVLNIAVCGILHICGTDVRVQFCFDGGGLQVL